MHLLLFEISGIVFFFSLNRKKKEDEIEKEEDAKNSLVCRFVLDLLGNKIGESVALDEDVLIIKSGSSYLGVPLKHIEEEGKTLLVKGLIDKEQAKVLGEKWRQESFSEIKYSKEEGK